MKAFRNAGLGAARVNRRLLKLGTVLGSGAAAAALLVPAAALAGLPARPPSTPPAQPQAGVFASQVIALAEPAMAFELDHAEIAKLLGEGASLGGAEPAPQDLTVLRPTRLSALGGGDVTASYGDITTTADNTPGVSTTSTGNTMITAGDITTSGSYSDGVIAAGTGAGSQITITTANVSTSGAGSAGIHALAGGDIAISAGNVTTSAASFAGNNAVGIYANSTGGSVTVQAQQVSTTGWFADGIKAQAAGDVTVTASKVATSGYLQSAGIYALSETGKATVTVSDVSTTGVYAQGIKVRAQSADVTLNGSINTYGTISAGIDVSLYGANVGDATLNINGSIHTRGATANPSQNADGIVVEAFDPSGGTSTAHSNITIGGGGNVETDGSGIDPGTGVYGVLAVSGNGGSVSISLGLIQTAGKGSIGVLAAAQDLTNADAGQPVSNVSVDVQSVTTTGANGSGIVAIDGAAPGASGATGAGGQVAIDVQDSVSTRGYGAMGIDVHAFNNNVSIDVGSNVSTLDDDAVAILALGHNLAINVGGTVSTQGDHTLGILSYSSGDTQITVGAVQTSGEYANGIVAIAPAPSSAFCKQELGCTGAGGAVTISAGSVTTAGKRSFGVYAFGYTAATINVGSIATQGDDSSALVAKTYSGQLSVTETGGIATQGQQSIGVFAQDADGTVDLTLTGAISTKGADAAGVIVTASNGAANVQANSITTTGAGAIALAVYSLAGSASVDLDAASTAGVKAPGVLVKGETGVTLTADQITTSGDVSNALIIRSGGYGVVGDATVNVGSISTTGERSAGVDAFTVGQSNNQASTLAITVGSITTTGMDSPGISAFDTYGAININASSISTRGAESTGMLVFGGSDISIQAGSISTVAADAIYADGAGSGTITVGVNGKVASSGANAIVAVNTGGATNITVASTGSVAGAADAIQVQTGGGPVSVSNAGSITGGTGFAIDVTPLSQGASAGAQIENTGAIVGAVRLSGSGVNALTNAGTFVATKDSDFGGGASQFVNTGVVKVGGGAAGTVNFLNLATFENAGGLIDLRNAPVGETFTLGGNYVASGDARLGLGVNGTAADELVIGGTATGATTILLNDTNPASATLLAKPLTLVQAGAGSIGTFTLANPDVGLIHYGLQTGSAAGGAVTYELTASAGAPVYGTLKLEQSAQTVWRQSADAWSEHLAAMRGDAWGGGNGSRSGRWWVQAYGSTGEHDETVSTGYGGRSVDYNQTDAGVQAGADLVRTATPLGAVGWGVTAGYASSHVDALGGALKSDIDTFDLGGYAALSHGPYFANALVKFDRHQITTSDGAAGYSASLNGSSYGAQFELGRHFGGERFAFEPTVSLTYVRTSLDTVSIYNQSLVFDDADGLSGKIGGRVYGARRLHDGTSLVFYAGAAVADDFTGEQRATFYSGGTSQNVSADGEGAYGQAVIGVSARTPRGLTLYLEGDGDFGGSHSGTGVRLGARF